MSSARNIIWEVMMCQTLRNVPICTLSTIVWNSSFFMSSRSLLLTFNWKSGSDLPFLLHSIYEVPICFIISHGHECAELSSAAYWWSVLLQSTICLNFIIGCFVFQSCFPLFTLSSEWWLKSSLASHMSHHIMAINELLFIDCTSPVESFSDRGGITLCFSILYPQELLFSVWMNRDKTSTIRHSYNS